MKNILYIVMAAILLGACAPMATSTENSADIQISQPTQLDQSNTQKVYTNSVFGFSFQYPPSWFGPDEYVSGQTLRVSVGSDIVDPYGEPPEQRSEVKNSYFVVIQYTKNNQNPYWSDIYQSLLNLSDGESFSGTRGLIIKVRQLDLGRFTGFEYISTLSETAQTDHVYGREILMVDKISNDLLTISGTPYNVELNNGTKWRDVYRMIDEANLAFFHEIVESITTE